MKQLTKEMKSVLNTWYNIGHRTGEPTEYWIQYGNLTNSSKYVCRIYDGDFLLCSIKYKRHDGIEENDIFEWETDNKETRNLIKRNWKRYA